MALVSTDLFVIQRPTDSNNHFKVTFEDLANEVSANSGAVEYKGTVDLTQTADASGLVTPYNTGDLYFNTEDGSIPDASYAGLAAGTAVDVGDRLLYNGTEWDLIKTGAGDIGVETVQGTLPITINDGDAGNPIVGIREATTANDGSGSGHVQRLATNADVAKDGTGDSTAVVTADLLKATNTALDAATAGGVTAVLAEAPLVVSTDGTNSSTSTQPSLAAPDAGVGVKGFATYATLTEAGEGTAADLAMTPAGVAAHYLPSDFTALGDA